MFLTLLGVMDTPCLLNRGGDGDAGAGGAEEEDATSAAAVADDDDNATAEGGDNDDEDGTMVVVVVVVVVVLLNMALFSAKERLEAVSGLCSPSLRILPGRDL